MYKGLKGYHEGLGTIVVRRNFGPSLVAHVEIQSIQRGGSSCVCVMSSRL